MCKVADHLDGREVIMRYLKVFFSFVALKYKIVFEYSAAFWAGCISQIIWYGVDFMLVWIVVDKFTNLAGWSAAEMMFLYALQLISYAIAGTFFFNSCISLGRRIQDGSFNDSLTVPLRPLIYEVLNNYNSDYIRHIVLATGLLVWSIKRIKLVVNFKIIVLIMIIVVCGTLIQAGAFLLLSAPNFWIIRGDKLLDLFFYDTIPFIRYPIAIYPKMIQGVLTFILPYAFINYYPTIYLFSNHDDALLFNGIQYVFPLVSVVFFCLGVMVWNLGITRYQSTGT